jgi:hypothetical protein
VDVRAALVADGQAAVTGEPRQRALDHPAMPPQFLAGVDAAPGNPGDDPTSAEVASAAREVVALIGVQLGRALPRPAGATARAEDRRDGVDQRLEEGRVVGVRRREADRQRDPVAVRDQMALRARFAAIRRIRPGLAAPPFAGTLALSRLARDQSIRSASPSQSSRVWCSRSHTPARCQSRSRRQQVTPLPQPASWGRYSQGSPVFSTKMIPVRQARSDTRGRPPFGFGGSGGISGSMARHSSSDTSDLFMPQHDQIPGHGIERRSQ